MSISTKIKPSLWFTGNAEEAVNFYTSVFPSSKITNVSRYTEVGKEHHQMEAGKVMVMEFTLHDQPFMAINGPPIFEFTSAISFVITCEDQQEVDHYSDKLGGEGGQLQPCGWVKDKFGIAWQVVPKALGEMMTAGTAEQKTRMSSAMFQMKKLDIAGLKKAFDGE